MTARTLVTFGSKRGGTAEIAARIADTLRERGLTVDCRRADEVHDLNDYDTVLVGGALYMNRWAREARRFVKRNARALRNRRIWMFSSGPLDPSANDGVIAPTKSVAALMALAGARGHATFGGRLAPDARGFPAAAMAKTKAGDWRSWDKVREWTAGVADVLRSEPRPTVQNDPQPISWPIALLCALVALTAIGGSIALVAAPDGSIVHMRTSELQHSPFASFLVPGLLLGGVIGLGNLVAAVLEVRRSRFANHAAFTAGAALLVWTVTEIAMLQAFQFLQPVYLIIAGVLVLESLRRWRPWRSAAASGMRGHTPC